MKYKIIKNYYSPMCGDWDVYNAKEPSHAICYRNCNFNCSFCNNKFHNEGDYLDLDFDQYVYIVNELMKEGNRFKFSGGEPTLNKYLKRDIQAIKELGGYIFLDTNGSNPEVILELAENKLIDVLGISLKGLSKKESIEVSGIKKGKLCWENVLASIQLASRFSNIKVIVTYVFYNGSGINELEQFAHLIAGFPNIYLKVNNLLYEKHHKNNLHAVGRDIFFNMMKEFVENNREWENRVIVVNTEKAISEYERIIFF